MVNVIAPNRASPAPAAAASASLADTYKKAAANAAALLVKDGSTVGFGTGSTATLFTAAVGARLAAGATGGPGALVGISGVPTSARTADQMTALNIPITDAQGPLQTVVDGADEIVIDGKETYAIKGGGGAMRLERIVANRALQLDAAGEPVGTYVLIVDESKLSLKLGTKFPLPVEVTKASVQAELKFLTRVGGESTVRQKDGQNFVSESGNYIIDVKFPDGIDNPKALEVMLNQRHNVKAHGLFINMADKVIVGKAGGTETIDIPKKLAKVTDSVAMANKAWEALARGATNETAITGLTSDNLRDLVVMLAKLREIPAAVSVMGSARTKPGDAEYAIGVELGRAFARWAAKNPPKEGEQQHALRTGAGPGNMQGPLEGARKQDEGHVQTQVVGSQEVLDKLTGVQRQGVQIILPHEQGTSPEVEESAAMKQFMIRKFGLFENSLGLIVTAGGYGTLDEMFEGWAIGTRRGHNDPLAALPFFAPLMNAIDQVARKDRPLVGEREWSEMKLYDHLDTPADFDALVEEVMEGNVKGFDEDPTKLELRLLREHTDVSAKLTSIPSGVTFLGHDGMKADEMAVLVKSAGLLANDGHTARLAGVDKLDKAVAKAVKDGGGSTAQAFPLTPEGGGTVKGNAALNVASVITDVAMQKLALTRNIEGIVAGPGDIETLGVVFSFLCEVQCKKVPAVPIVLVGTSYWQPIFDAIKKMMLEGEVKMISPEDLDLVTITDDPAVVAKAFPAKKTPGSVGSSALEARASGTSRDNAADAIEHIRSAYGKGFDVQRTLENGQMHYVNARHEGRPLTVVEQQAVADAERLLDAGYRPVNPVYEGVRNNGWRDYQTQISLANPGLGHMNVTAKFVRLLKRGLVVHNEYIDRESKDVAPYRAVDAGTNSKLAYKVAGEAPVTVYYGRPNYQSSVRQDGQEIVKDHSIWYETDKVTPVHDLGTYATAVFGAGTCDVKVAMDGLTASQTIDFMQRVANEKKIGKRVDQTFSAAFNLNRVLIDDRPETLALNGGQPRVLNPRPNGVDGEPDAAVMREIALVSVELAKAGRWEKVTLDSASDKIPSDPLMQLMGFANLLEWTHAAHSAGLETYISGGMRGDHFNDAVYSGVGGVGVGTSMHSKILDAGKFLAGDIDPDIVTATLDVRDAAAATSRGIGSRLLVQLDRIYSELAADGGSLPRAIGSLRAGLFAELSKGAAANNDTVSAFIEQGKAFGFLEKTPPVIAAAKENE